MAGDDTGVDGTAAVLCEAEVGMLASAPSKAN